MIKKACSILRLPMLLVAGAILNSCGLSLYDRYELGVPYREQEQFDYCVPASVLMWRLYHRLPEISQTTIYNWLGGSACSPYQVPGAVNHFTNTRDAYLDVVSSTARDELIARQITSEDQGSPVIAIVGPYRDHVGVVNGGKYKKQGEYYVWEFLYFHDPGEGEGIYYAANDWLNFFCPSGASFCGQIVSVNATTGWASYYATYRTKILTYGGTENCTLSNCGPFAY